MPRLASIAAVLVLFACAKTEQPVKDSPSPGPRRPSTQVVMGFVVDSARNQALAAAAAAPATIEEPAEVLDLEDDSLSDPIELISSKIDTTITLGAWLKAHPADRVGMVAPVGSSTDDQFCRAAVVKVHKANVTFVRSALFYMPAPPKGEKLPTDTANVAEAQCQMGAIALASAESDLTTAQVLRDSLAHILDHRLGSHRGDVPEFGGGVPGAQGAMMWQSGNTSVVVASQNRKRESAETPTPPGTSSATGAKVYAVAYTPGSGPADFDSWEARYEDRHGVTADDRQLRYRDLDSAIVWAGMPGVVADLKTVLSYLRTRDEDESRELKPPQIDAALLRAMKAIHQAAPSLPPVRRAAALLAGDIAFGALYGLPSADSGAAIANAIPSLGITLNDYDEGGHYYAHSWLWEAYRTDSTSRAGRAAIVQLLGLRWPDNNSCNGDEYKRVIEHGEAALARGDNDPRIHYYLGSAYKTTYDLAHYENEEVGNPSAYKAEADPARLKGIEHFRAALESLPDRATRREAWLKAMQLLLRRSGDQPEYVCFAD